MTDRSKETESLRELLAEQVQDARRRNRQCPHRPFTVYFACGTPWTVTGPLASRMRGQMGACS